MMLKTLDAFHKTRLGYLVFGLVELGLAYLFISLAINSGSLWQWGTGLCLFIAGLQEWGMLVWKAVRR